MRWLPAFLLFALVLACAGCKRAPAPAPHVVSAASQVGPDNSDFGAVSVDAPKPKKHKVDIAKTTEWPDAALQSGVAVLGCNTDPTVDGEGIALSDLDFFNVLDAMLPCKDTGVLRLRYRGRIAGDFTTLVERVGNMSVRMGIKRRILDIDSSGGQVEDAIRAGDLIANANWTIWVRHNAVCHSACVLLLAGGDDRVIDGAVGIHRIIRIQSDATSRAELSAELREVHDEMKSYLERNGAGVAVADFMMTVPNRGLRLLTPAELDTYGLSGRNAAQEDLERIGLVRRCGLEFVRREDAFFRAFDRQCAGNPAGQQAIDGCGLQLRGQFGFPDKACPADSPLADVDAPSSGPAPVDAATPPKPGAQ